MNVLCSARTILYMAALRPEKLGGIECFARQLALAAGPLGWAVVLCGETEPSPAVRRALALPNLAFDVMPGQAGIRLGQSWRFARLLAHHRPRVVVYHLGGTLRTFPFLAKLLGVRKVVYQDGCSRASAARSMGRGRRAIARALARPIDQVIAATRYVERCVRGEGLVRADRVRVVHNSVDTTVALDREARRRRWRRRYGVADEDPVVMQVGWMVPAKGFETLLRAAPAVLRAEPRARFVLVGEGSHRKEYERLADRLGIAGRLVWTGQIENPFMEGIYAMADVYCQLSQWQEAGAFTLAEAMSYHLPIVATDVGGNSEAVRPGVNGILTGPADVDAVAAGILELLRDPERRRALGERGRTLAEREFDVKVAVREYLRHTGIDGGSERTRNDRPPA